MAKNMIATIYDDNAVPVATAATGKGAPNFTALCVTDFGVPILTSSGGSTTVAVASGNAALTVVKATAGRLARISVTSAAGTTTGNTNIYDNASAASGTILVVVPNNTTVGNIIDVQMPALTGITVNGVANSPGMTISYA